MFEPFAVWFCTKKAAWFFASRFLGFSNCSDDQVFMPPWALQGQPEGSGQCLGIEFGQVIEEKDVFKLMRGLPTKIFDSILILVGIDIFWGSLFFDLPPDGGDWSYSCSERVRVQVAELLVPLASYESKRSGAKPLGITLRISTSSVKLLEPNPCIAQSLKRLEFPAWKKYFVAQAQWASILQWIHWEELVCRVISVCLLCWDIVPSMYNCIKHNFNIFGTSSYHIISPHIIIRSEKIHTLHLDKHQKFSGS